MLDLPVEEKNGRRLDVIFLTIRSAEVELEIDVDIEKKILYYIGMRYSISINDIY